MKKLSQTICLVFSLGLVAVSCSSDDNGGNKDYLKGVPKGEIVPVGERFVTLTGFEEGEAGVSSREASQANSQKWWKYIYGEIEYNCEGENDVEEIEEVGYYYAFFPNGKMYYKDGISGTPYAYNDWEWADSSKSKIRISNNYGESQVFEFTELNANAVVYASYQSYQGCSLLTWEQMGNPVYEENSEEDNGNSAGRYIWWTKEDITVDDGSPVLSVKGNFVKDGKIWDTPYRYSTDGINWVTNQWDGVTSRSFINFSGNFWAERSYTSVLNLTYTSVHGTGTLVVDRLLTGVNPISGPGEEGCLAWDGGNTAYALANASYHGGNFNDGDVVIKSTDGGNTWASITHQPPKSEGHQYFSYIYLINQNLYLVERIDYTKYRILHSSNGGLSGGWDISPIYEDGGIRLQGVAGFGGTQVYATNNGGTYTVAPMTPTISVQPVQFESGNNIKAKVYNISGNSDVLLPLFHSKEVTGGVFILNLISNTLYNPSNSGLNSYHGSNTTSEILIFGNHLVSVSGGKFYKTPLPLQFYDTRD